MSEALPFLGQGNGHSICSPICWDQLSHLCLCSAPEGDVETRIWIWMLYLIQASISRRAGKENKKKRMLMKFCHQRQLELSPSGQLWEGMQNTHLRTIPKRVQDQVHQVSTCCAWGLLLAFLACPMCIPDGLPHPDSCLEPEKHRYIFRVTCQCGHYLVLV